MKKDSLFELLKRNDLGLKNDIYKKVFSLSTSKIFDILSDIQSIMNSHENDINLSKKTSFKYVVSDYLSGGKTGCCAISCRNNRLNEMLMFAGLYADSIIIRDQFSDYYNKDNFSNIDKQFFAEDVIQLWKMKPFFENGILRFCQSDFHICPECLQRFATNNVNKYKNKLDKYIKYVFTEVKKTTKVFAYIDDEEYCIEFEGTGDILGHETTIFTFSDHYPTGITYGNAKNKKRVYRPTAEKYGLYNGIVEDIIDDFTIQDYYTKKYKYNYLTSKSFDSQLINAMQKDVIKKKSEAVYNGFRHALPIIQMKDAEKILEIREKEGEAFENYRSTVNKILENANGSINGNKEIYNDLIEPEIRKINMTIKKTRKDKLISLGRDVMIKSGLLAIGIYTGILPKNITEIVSVVGGLDLSSNIINDAIAIKKIPDKVKENPYYFVWKINQ